MCVCVLQYSWLLPQAYHVTGICCLVSMVTRAHVTSWGSLRKSVNDALHYIHDLIAVIITLSKKSNFKSHRFYQNSRAAIVLFILPVDRTMFGN